MRDVGHVVRFPLITRLVPVSLVNIEPWLGVARLVAGSGWLTLAVHVTMLHMQRSRGEASHPEFGVDIVE